jgi:excisionase family DNA binding protein
VGVEMPESQKLIVDDTLASELFSLRELLLHDDTAEIILRDASGQEQSLSPSATDFFRTIVAMGTQSRLTIQPLPPVITTTVAADLLGTTRPTLRKWIQAGILPAHKVGSHTKLKTADVLALRDKRLEERRAAFESLRAFEENFFPADQ